MMMIQKKIIVLTLLIILPGCSLYTPESRNPLPDNYPSGYSLYSEKSREKGEKWWESFHSPELNHLVEKAMGDNFSIREAWARLKQATASAKKARADYFPELSGEAGYAKSRTRSESDNGNGDEKTTESFSMGLAASYEVDLWGKIRSGREASVRNMEAGRADLDAAATTVAASVAETWIDILAARQELDLLDQQVKANESLLKLQELRFEKSRATALDVLQQKQLLERTRSNIPPVKARERLLQNALAILTGEPPGVATAVSQADIPPLSPLPPTGLPADLLAMRPDIRAAGLRLKAADWEIAAARADRLPALSITGRATYSSEKIDTLFDNWILNLAANLTGPLFDAGRREAEVTRTRAVAEERLAFYEKTVVNAVGEVEDSLINESMQKKQIALLEKELHTARQVLREAENHYIRGVDTYLPILTELLTLQNLERDLILQKASLIKYRIALYRSLGGEWTSLLTPEGLAEAPHTEYASGSLLFDKKPASGGPAGGQTFEKFDKQVRQ